MNESITLESSGSTECDLGKVGLLINHREYGLEQDSSHPRDWPYPRNFRERCSSFDILKSSEGRLPALSVTFSRFYDVEEFLACTKRI